ncbi:hypothetical protein BGW80DRAFT_1253890 [Lactifluus volemus]|nr:hypothetical protein BGW80DRAFT_1253890 [Lactifluus volemus]
MATCISALTSLTNLTIAFISPASRPDPRIRRPPPLKRAVLPALTSFDFHGVSEYLEDLMAQIDAPLLRVAQIRFFNQLVFGIQQLPRFIGHAPAFMSCNMATMYFSYRSVEISLSSTRPSEYLTFEISCGGVDWQVSSMAQICNQLSFLLSGIEQLKIYRKPDMPASTFQVDMDDTQWLELFHPFTALQTLGIYGPLQSLIVSALQGLGEELAMEVLPALENPHLERYRASGSEQEDIKPFIIARQRSAHPVTVTRVKCPVCGKRFLHTRDFARHFDDCHSDPKKCPECDEMLVGTRKLQAHLQRTHNFRDVFSQRPLKPGKMRQQSPMDAPGPL